MSHFLFVLINIILPILIQIGIGYGVQKKFKLDVGTLSKVQFYVFTPAILFVKIYETDMKGGIFLSIFLFSIILFAALYLIGWMAALIGRYSKSFTKAFINSVSFFNAGNYCLPLVELLYHSPFALSVQIFIMMFQNILTNTVGVFNASSGKNSIKGALISILKIPLGYAIIAALVLKSADIKVWGPLWSAAGILSQGLIPMALFTLGAQLANTSMSFRIPRVYLSNTIRLVVSPVVAFFITRLLGVEGIAAQVMVIASAAPTAVNTVLMSIEFDNEPEFASQTVFSSTVFSAITMTLVIILVQNFLQAASL